MDRGRLVMSAKRTSSQHLHQSGLRIEGPLLSLLSDLQPFCVTNEGHKSVMQLATGPGPQWRIDVFVSLFLRSSWKWRKSGVFPKKSSLACISTLLRVWSSVDDAVIIRTASHEEKIWSTLGEKDACCLDQTSWWWEVRGGLWSKPVGLPGSMANHSVSQFPKIVTWGWSCLHHKAMAKISNSYIKCVM